MTPPDPNAIAKAGLCAGCGACASLSDGAVSMDLSGDGFLRPVQSGSLPRAARAAIADVCPGVTVRQQAAEGAQADPLWGPYLSVKQGWAENPALRRQASSGGVLSAVLHHLLASGQVKFIVQTGADPNIPYANQTRASRTGGAIFEAAGSRYAPSAPLENLEDYLARGEPFAFVGKPCDVAALRAMARRDPRINAHVRVMLSFFCAGAPSLKGAEALLAKMGAPKDEVTRFRYRGDGWPGFARADLETGEARQLSYEESWGAVLSKHVQYRCKICPDGVGGAADIVCADAWECDEKGYPLFGEREGVSLVLARTDQGAKILAEAETARVVRLQEARVDDIAAMQPSQARRKRLIASRLAARRALLRLTPRYDGVGVRQAARMAGPSESLRSFLGSVRRLLKGEG